jgi:hypothetical protein
MRSPVVCSRSRSRSGSRIALAGAAFGAVSLAMPGAARAEWTVGASAGVAAPVSTQELTESNVGFTVDVSGGYRIPLGVVALRPELVAGYAGMSMSILRARAGLRLETRGLVAPYAFARAGAARVSYETTASFGAPTSTPVVSSEHAGALAYDMGLGLSVAPPGMFELDVHAAFNGVRGAAVEDGPIPDATWLTACVGVTAHF